MGCSWIKGTGIESWTQDIKAFTIRYPRKHGEDEGLDASAGLM